MRSEILFLFSVLLFPFPAFGGGEGPGPPAEGAFPVMMSSGQPAQGEPLFVEASPPSRTDAVVMIWKGQEIPMREEPPGRFLGLIGIDLLEPPGEVPLSVRATRGGERFRVDVKIAIRQGSFPVQELTLPEAMTQFDRGTLERIREIV